MLPRKIYQIDKETIDDYINDSQLNEDLYEKAFYSMKESGNLLEAFRDIYYLYTDAVFAFHPELRVKEYISYIKSKYCDDAHVVISMFCLLLLSQPKLTKPLDMCLKKIAGDNGWGLFHDLCDKYNKRENQEWITPVLPDIRCIIYSDSIDYSKWTNDYSHENIEALIRLAPNMNAKKDLCNSLTSEINGFLQHCYKYYEELPYDEQVIFNDLTLGSTRGFISNEGMFCIPDRWKKLIDEEDFYTNIRTFVEISKEKGEETENTVSESNDNVITQLKDEIERLKEELKDAKDNPITGGLYKIKQNKQSDVAKILYVMSSMGLFESAISGVRFNKEKFTKELTAWLGSEIKNPTSLVSGSKKNKNKLQIFQNLRIAASNYLKEK